MFENPWNSRKLNLQELGPAGQKGQGEEQEHPMLGADSVWEKDFAAGYDMCIVFPAVDGEFTEVGNSYIDIMKKLDLDMFAYRGVRGREIFVLARVPLPKLRAFADKVDIRMKLDGTIAQQMLEKGNIEAGIGPVIIPHRPDICPFQPYEHLFGKYDRATPQDLYYHTPGNNDPFAQVRLKLCELLLESESADGTAGLKFRLHLRHGTLLGVFPLHDKTQTQALGAQWARFPQAELPLHYIKEYFGEKVPACVRRERLA
ncbi:hypothetical protein B484DRAFT_156051 [Ochromonadaceae sp. CCMP2298]|nr:hypothetical protein B484DRAFT_156051 [Ochromonadaceae sp. CCMP2298]